MRKQLIVAVIGLGAIAFALWWFFGQRRPADPTAGAHKTSEMLPKEILTQEQVIRVAKDTWRAAKGVELGEGTPIEVSLDVGKNEYTVLFKTPVLPPGSLS